jgi:hypothetical protein
MRFLAGAMPGSDESTVSVIYHRRIVVQDSSIEAVALSQDQYCGRVQAFSRGATNVTRLMRIALNQIHD